VTADDLAALHDYSCWANGKFFDVIAGLSDDAFTREVAGSYGSLRNTLVHMVSAEAGWIERCGGPARGPKLDPADFPTFASVRERATRVEAQMRAFLGSLTDADLARAVEFSLPGGPSHAMRIGELLQHSFVHGTHHRGQIALLLRALGHAPGNVDILLYYLAKQAPV
jgi:uncharacterized damage-inducible protein DinB